MNGLEAIELMKKGKMVQNERCIYKLENGEVLFKNKLNVDDEFLKSKSFNFTSNYEEYIEPKQLTGWERREHWEDSEGFYTIVACDAVADRMSYNHVLNEKCYKNANYFSTEEKAEEINFKQTLFRKLQRFSDENGGNEIDWNKGEQRKWMIRFDHGVKRLYVVLNTDIQNFGQVYFVSKKITEQAIELFHDQLIKYFTM